MSATKIHKKKTKPKVKVRVKTKARVKIVVSHPKKKIIRTVGKRAKKSASPGKHKPKYVVPRKVKPKEKLHVKTASRKSTLPKTEKVKTLKNKIASKADSKVQAVLNPNLSDKALHDYHLVRKAVDQGDQKAFAELMQRYKDSIYFMLLKMVNNRDDADDLTIEAFGKAFKNIRQYTPDYAFSTWLFKIATNNCIDFIRKKRKQAFSIDKGFENEDGQDITLEVKSELPDPSEHLMKKQKVELMRDVVDKLKPRYKVLVELRYYREFSYEEIAEELKLPLGTVKAQLFRAREFLYQIMKSSMHTI